MTGGGNVIVVPSETITSAGNVRKSTLIHVLAYRQ